MQYISVYAVKTIQKSGYMNMTLHRVLLTVVVLVCELRTQTGLTTATFVYLLNQCCYYSIKLVLQTYNEVIFLILVSLFIDYYHSPTYIVLCFIHTMTEHNFIQQTRPISNFFYFGLGSV